MGLSLSTSPAGVSTSVPRQAKGTHTPNSVHAALPNSLLPELVLLAFAHLSSPQQSRFPEKFHRFTMAAWLESLLVGVTLP